jgi:hypothetical protein
MNSPLNGSPSTSTDAFLAGAYRRILWIAITFSVAATIAATVLFSWRSGLVLAVGSLLAYLNFVWLHHSTELMVERMLAPAADGPSKFRLMLVFAGRYIFVIAVAYVILKSYPRMLVAFMLGLVFPVLAAMCEGVYEALVSNTKQN